MSANEKLRSLEAELKSAGVVDVKFFFSKEGHSPTKVANDVANVLTAMMSGRTSKFVGLDDANIVAATA